MSLRIDRAAAWEDLGAEPWDLIVIGGGITGAGVLREAVRAGYRTLLVEQRDFAWGTSSRSSKMVHGGLRYLATGDVKLTWHSLRERERLVAEAPGLIERMGYYVPIATGARAKRLQYMLGIRAYAAMAGTRDARYVGAEALGAALPGFDSEGQDGACYYTDTVTDDARLVLRVLQEALGAAAPGQARALNYVAAGELEITHGQLRGLTLRDEVTGAEARVTAKAVINATGSWADRLRGQMGAAPRIRPLRGSHLVFARARLPIEDALILSHPEDGRPVFIYPWEGATVAGTTDLDHPEDLNREAAISPEEVAYLLGFVQAAYPELGLGRADILSSWAGVRPVIGAQNSRDPSKERRDHAVWRDGNLITVAGGKLTTFRLMARDALKAAAPFLPAAAKAEGAEEDRVFPQPLLDPGGSALAAPWARLEGRYGAALPELLAHAPEAERAGIGATPYCLAECRWAAGQEGVVHLDDLMLRRTRLGNLLPQGGAEILPALEAIFAQEAGWGPTRWEEERARYEAIWARAYSLPS